MVCERVDYKVYKIKVFRVKTTGGYLHAVE